MKQVIPSIPYFLRWNIVLLIGMVLFQITCLTSYGQNRKERTGHPLRTVVFVCEHGAARSLIASAYFNKMAQQRKLPVRAIFRGLQPDSTLSKHALMGLESDGITVPNEKPSRLTRQDMANALQVVALDCTLPQLDLEKQHHWEIHSSISQDYENARNEIKKNVEALLRSLSEQPFK